jgi:hypothetical protein
MIEDVICPRLSRRSTFALAAVVLLGLEVAIACYAPPGWLRGFVGDVLVVALMYAAFGLCRPTTTTITDARLALAALLFAYAIEVLQAFGLVDLLGLHNATPLHRVLRIALGATFDPWDLVAYTCGWGLFRAASRWPGRQATLSSSISSFTYPPTR